jgi:hypothetical protein
MTSYFSRKRIGAAVAVAVLVAGSVVPAFALTRFSRVEAYSTDRWTVWVPSGSSMVVVDGDGDTDLDCFVYDRFGNLLGMDDDSTDYCVVPIYAATSGNVTIRIQNLGRVYNEYRLSVE